MEPGMVSKSVVADLHHYDKEQDPDPHQSGKSDPDSYQSEKSDQSKNRGPDPDQHKRYCRSGTLVSLPVKSCPCLK
jgi:hypothetical protein